MLTLGVSWSAIPDTPSDAITENILDKLKVYFLKIAKTIFSFVIQINFLKQTMQKFFEVNDLLQS